MRDQLPLNPIEFKDDSEVLASLRTILTGWDAQLVHGIDGAVLEGYLESATVTSITEGGYRADYTILLRVSVVSHMSHRITVSSVAFSARLEDGSTVEGKQESSKLTEWLLLTDEKIQDPWGFGQRVKTQEENLDELFPKIHESPLEYGVQKTGWLLFEINDIDAKALEGAQIFLLVEDSLGNVHTIAATMPWHQRGRVLEKSWLR